ncbi:unnamed protein product [Musa acuminata subsp. malaccensis]|uniref:Ninja-family protein n=1 Tax=Musa acuminata subsp. malaccensis TaxID=214687 RepID=A0A804JPK6_MUSAM|nr:PREDICTED: ninja-family protein AFP3-like [Musa acuminata subsp. malaccensis]CAG1848507.1 unnamed protein product [Musa acuminata subsp. malaccensis]
MEEELSARAPGCQKDFLTRFGAGGGEQGEKRTPWGDGGSGETELSLGLSLGGRVGLEPKEKRLVRPSSFSTFPTERDFSVNHPVARTCSLQAEAEVEHRKSKELQGLKRLEANGTVGRKNKIFDKEFARFRNGVVLHRPPAWADTAGRVDASKRFGLASPVSIGSEGSSCSSLYDIDSQPNQGLSNISEVRSSLTATALSDQSICKPKATVLGQHVTCVTEVDDRPRKAARGGPKTKVLEKVGKKMIQDMPCVSTIGDGPNGRRIEGLLYKYGKGEEVKIVCVCHGSFFSPAEFVKHAGSGDVAHPLRHIVVSTLPAKFL